MTPAKYSYFFTPSPSCAHLELTDTLKFTQFPYYICFSITFPHLRYTHHIWMLPNESKHAHALALDIREITLTHRGTAAHSYCINLLQSMWF